MMECAVCGHAVHKGECGAERGDNLAGTLALPPCSCDIYDPVEIPDWNVGEHSHLVNKVVFWLFLEETGGMFLRQCPRLLSGEQWVREMLCSDGHGEEEAL